MHRAGAVRGPRRPPWSERAAQELRASEETALRRKLTIATEPTGQERQVAVLVQPGLSSRDVAATYVRQPYLRNVFSKLGITSRAELTTLSLDR